MLTFFDTQCKIKYFPFTNFLFLAIMFCMKEVSCNYLLASLGWWKPDKS
ncbi:hypothetical protein HMPREF0813_00894 [Streptococcus anginosus F0211]|uniref:Uncharacterized protein n=1 Tax=Streptococcus anginosus F0211 TaxID=706437 RepID=E6J0X1_STRAP|nr:hypothetical protein HMPREF0813_00894 [Streptococcus anginosus F0211]